MNGMNGADPRLFYVVDASVVAKWHVPPEWDTDVALQLRDQLVAGALRLAAPEHMMVEVIRVLQLGVRDRHYGLDDGLELMHAFLALPVTYFANEDLFEAAFRLSTEYQMALYDSLYLALARLLDIPFITADRRFYNLSQNRAVAHVEWLGSI